MKYKRPESTQNLTFDYLTYDDWFTQFIKTSNYNQKGAWTDFFVQNIDYLANPSVINKNYSII